MRVQRTRIKQLRISCSQIDLYYRPPEHNTYSVHGAIIRLNEHELKLHCVLVGCPSVVVNGARKYCVRVRCTRMFVQL